MRTALCAALLLAPLSLPSADAALVDEDVVATATQVPASQEAPGWASLAPKLESPEALQALDSYLKAHPKGPAAARAQIERAKRLENLEQAMEAYRAAVSEDRGGGLGAEAGLELGKLEYAMGRTEAAMVVLNGVAEDLLSGNAQAELLFWRAQTRLVLKGVQKAQDDFEALLKNFPGHPLADSAAMGVADCDAALKNDEAALKGYQRLYQDPPSSVAPHALWQAAALQLRAGRKEEARPLLQRLAQSYADSFEASRARELLASLPSAPAVKAAATPTKPKGGHFTIQVGAYSQRSGALKLYRQLKKAGYVARMNKRVLEDNVFHLVQVGRYPSKPAALKAAKGLLARQHLTAYSIVDIP